METQSSQSNMSRVGEGVKLQATHSLTFYSVTSVIDVGVTLETILLITRRYRNRRDKECEKINPFGVVHSQLPEVCLNTTVYYTVHPCF